MDGNWPSATNGTEHLQSKVTTLSHNSIFYVQTTTTAIVLAKPSNNDMSTLRH